MNEQFIHQLESKGEELNKYLSNAVLTNNSSMVEQLLRDFGNAVIAKRVFLKMLNDGQATAQLVKVFLDYGVDIEQKDDKDHTPLMLVARHNNLDAAELLIERNANINAQRPAGQTALMEAAKSGHLDMVKLLLSKGADISLKVVKSGMTAVGMAEMGEHDLVATHLRQWELDKIAGDKGDEPDDLAVL